MGSRSYTSPFPKDRSSEARIALLDTGLNDNFSAEVKKMQVYKKEGSLLGVPITRIMISWGLFWSPYISQQIATHGHKANMLLGIPREL